MSSQSGKRQLFYPEPVQGPDLPLNPSERKDPNPRLYGWILVIAAFLMESFGFVRRAAWANAGFGRLRDIREHLMAIEPRYDPTVFPAEQEVRVDEKRPGLVDRAFDAVPTQHKSAVSSYRSLYLSGDLTPLDVARAILPLIRRDTEPPGEHAVAFLEVQADLVLKAAAASTLRYRENRSLGPLDGVPTAVKDEYDMEGFKTTFGSPNDYATFRLFGRGSGRNTDKNVTSWCVRMAEEAGVVILGKLSLNEFGLDTAGCNAIYGTPRNPYNPEYYPGGSSSGCAYAVATGLIPITLGSDGGGSIRIPASYCSVFGLKPTHGRLPFLPGQNHSNTASVNGPMAADVRSLAELYDVVKKAHPRSHFPMTRPVCLDLSDERNDGQPKLLGIPERWFDGAEPAVQKLCRAMLDRLVHERGYKLIPIAIPFTSEGQVAHSITLLTDAATIVHDTTGVTPANRILLALGSTTTAMDYQLAQKLRHLLMQHLAWLWQEHPGMIIVTPTTANAGWPIRSESELRYGVSDGDETMRSMKYVWLANLCGIPSITVPAGLAPPVGSDCKTGEGDIPGSVPVGLMGMGEWCSEESLLRFGLDAEEVGESVQRRPPNWVDVLAIAKSLKGAEAGGNLS